MPTLVVGRRGLVAELGQVDVEAPPRRADAGPSASAGRAPRTAAGGRRSAPGRGPGWGPRARTRRRAGGSRRRRPAPAGSRGTARCASACSAGPRTPARAGTAAATTGRARRDRAVPARRELAEQDLRARVGALDRRPRGAHEPAVDVRRGREADAPRDARLLRLEPARDVRLVPDQVAVDAVAVARRHRARELREQPRRRLVARVARAAARGEVHSGPGPVTLSITLHPGGAREVDRAVERRPVVAARAMVGEVEAARPVHARRGRARPRSSARGCARRRRPRRPMPATAPSACDGRGEQQPLVLHADLEVRGGVGGRGEGERQRGRERRPPDHRGATCASRDASPPQASRHTPAALGTRTRKWPLRERTVTVLTVANAPPRGGRTWICTTCGRRVGRRAHLPVDPQPRAAPGHPDRQPVGVVGRLRAAVDEAQPGLEARQRRLVDELVLRHRAHPRVAVGHPVGLVDVGGLPRRRARRRCGPAGWSGSRTPCRRPAAAAGSAAPAPPVEHPPQPRGRGDRDLARAPGAARRAAASRRAGRGGARSPRPRGAEPPARGARAVGAAQPPARPASGRTACAGTRPAGSAAAPATRSCARSATSRRAGSGRARARSPAAPRSPARASAR